MAKTIDLVRQRLGIFYSEPAKDAELTQLIEGAVAIMKDSGWDEVELIADELSPQAVEAMVLYAKMAINTDPGELSIHPVWISLLAAARMRKQLRISTEEGMP